jgi:hypothetical protein
MQSSQSWPENSRSEASFLISKLVLKVVESYSSWGVLVAAEGFVESLRRHLTHSYRSKEVKGSDTISAAAERLSLEDCSEDPISLIFRV